MSRVYEEHTKWPLKKQCGPLPSSPDCHVTYVPPTLLQPSAQPRQQWLIPGRRAAVGRGSRGGIQFLRRPRHPHNFHPSLPPLPTDRPTATDRATERESRGPKANNLHLGHVSLLDHLRSCIMLRLTTDGQKHYIRRARAAGRTDGRPDGRRPPRTRRGANTPSRGRPPSGMLADTRASENERVAS